jgi:hypothetical protein
MWRRITGPLAQVRLTSDLLPRTWVSVSGSFSCNFSCGFPIPGSCPTSSALS